MRIIIESGSTKSDWRIINNQGEITELNTVGFNPRFVSSEFIVQKLQENAKLSEISEHVKSIRFFGAGCANDVQAQFIKDSFLIFFPNASIEVFSDLLAAAYATFKGIPVIACILGTGSNSCYYDGKQLVQNSPALGYILGDEGSGSYLGKCFITDLLYQKLPNTIAENFQNEFPEIDKEYIINRVYREPNANVFLASFSKFIGKHIDSDYLKELVFNSFDLFVKNHVLCYPQAQISNISFVGSVAYFFQDILKEVLNSNNLQLGEIIKSPIDHLSIKD